MCRRFKWNICSQRNRYLIFITLSIILMTLNLCTPPVSGGFGLQWKLLPEIPPAGSKRIQPGLAGPVAGACRNFLMVAGGANFEDNLPWRGGNKSYHDEIFLLEKKTDGTWLWKQTAEKLPYPMAYAACLTTAKGVISIGGENETGPVRDVRLFVFGNGTLFTEYLPSLPVAVTSPGATSIGYRIFVAGGSDTAGAVSHFFTLDLNNLQKGWEILPDLPVPVTHSVVVAQKDGTEDCIYVIGGRNRTSDVHTFFSTIWKYVPSKALWQMEGDIFSDGKRLPLSAGTGIAAGKNHILLFGGDPGIFFNLTERLNNALDISGDSVKQLLLACKDSLLVHHPGFSRTVLAYNTITKNWENTGYMQPDSPVTTVAFFWGDNVIIPSGEIRPGVRTPQVLMAELQ